MLTSAVLLSAKTQNDEEFKTYVTQLRVLYNDYSDCSDEATKCTVLGLNLLRLLADDQLASFHCELELLSSNELGSSPVTFATTLAQSLSEGTLLLICCLLRAAFTTHTQHILTFFCLYIFFLLLLFV